jgi:hypothetical protein
MQSEEQKNSLARRLCAWAARRPEVVLALLVVVSLAPFLTKPFNMDEPLFLWAARQIQAHPLDPYGFVVNWYDRSELMWVVTKNPPLACYYLAVAAAVVGWSEAALHGAFLLPAIAAILGTHRLAKHFCPRPMLAACATLWTPVFLVSSTSVMCDTMMLAFWVWAIVLFVESLRKTQAQTACCEWKIWASGALILFAALTKYYGICLLPLLGVYGWMTERKLGRWALGLVLPLIGVAIYQWATFALYGHGLFSDAAAYASGSNRGGFAKLHAGLVALSFTGGCLGVATFFGPLVWRWRALGIVGLVTLVYAGIIFGSGGFWPIYRNSHWTGTSHAWVVAQLVVWVFGGVSALGMAAADVWRRRDSVSVLLALWVAGTFLFAGFCNWVTNARSVLPMAPAIGILLARRLEPGASLGRELGAEQICGVMVAGAALSLAVAFADAGFAQVTRTLAGEVCAKYKRDGATLWFGGHWGWQYYMEQFGAKVVVAGESVPKDGDFLVLPRNNTNPLDLNRALLQDVELMTTPGSRWLATLNLEVGAGFYASIWGPLPFGFGKVPPEAGMVESVKLPVKKTPP